MSRRGRLVVATLAKRWMEPRHAVQLKQHSLARRSMERTLSTFLIVLHHAKLALYLRWNLHNGTIMLHSSFAYMLCNNSLSDFMREPVL
jgi:hypothetical protein